MQDSESGVKKRFVILPFFDYFALLACKSFNPIFSKISYVFLLTLLHRFRIERYASLDLHISVEAVAFG